jgi:uncharacterized protein with FMN-binding domain
MRRALFAVTGLAAGTTMLVALKGGPSATPVAQKAPAGVVGAPAGAEPAGRPGAVPGAPAPGAAAPGTRAPSARPPAGPSAGPARRAPAPARTSTAPAAPEAPAGPSQVDGSVQTNEYGTVQVRVRFDGTRITSVEALQMPEDNTTTRRKSEQVQSTLSAQAVQRQSADVDTVSGATETSESYRRSLRAALDRAGR